MLLLLVFLALVWTCQAAESISLEDAVRILKERGYDRKIADLEEKKAEGNLLQAGLFQNPNVYFNYTGLNFGKHILYDTGNTLLAIGISQPFELGGKRQYRRLSARFALEAVQYQQRDYIRGVVRGFLNVYFQALSDRAYADYLKRDIEDFGKTLLIQTKRQELGFLSLIDLLKLKLYKGELEDALEKAKTAYMKDLKDMAFYLGQQYEPVDVPEEVQEPALEDLLRMALEKRENLKALEKQIESTDYQIKLLKSYSVPDITISVEYDAFGVQYKPGLGVGVSVSLPLFDKRQGDLLTALATKEQLLVLLEKNKSSLRTEITKAFYDFRTNLQVYRSLQERKKIMEDTLERVKRAYAIGGISTLDFIDTLRTYRSFMQSLLQAKYDMLLSYYYLKLLAGAEP